MKTTPEQREHRKELVAALRSGTYVQGNGALRVAGKSVVANAQVDVYCCLGVACDLYIKHHPAGPVQWVPIEKHLHGRMNSIPVTDNDSAALDTARTGTMPRKVQQWYGIYESADITEFRQATLINMNDSGENFDTIARAIETAP